MVVRLVSQLASTRNIDSNRLYTTGQSMGGMMSMYYNITYPDLFAASLFVDCHWDKSKFDELARHTFTYVTAGSVLPADGKGSEHMYSFDYAYRLTPVLQWMFRQSKK